MGCAGVVAGVLAATRRRHSPGDSVSWPTVTSPVDRIAAVLRLHRLATTAWGQTHCWCQQNVAVDDFGMGYEHHAAHVAERVAAVVKPDVERLARAIWNADKPWSTGDRDPFGTVKPVEWEIATERMRDVYRHMARKVLAELDQEET